MSYLDKLNPNQKEAVLSEEKYLRVIAGAGSGKTRVLTSRIINLLEKGVSPFRILAITFTNKAAKEMRDRVLTSVDLKSYPLISTFHSFCARLLREDFQVLNYKKDFNILDEEDKTQLIKTILKDLNIAKDYLDYKDMLNYISYQKTNFKVTPYFKSGRFQDQLEEDKKMVYDAYEKKVKNMNSLDFDDLLLKAYETLTKNKDVLKKWQNRYSYILVDEFQDTNDLQFELVKLLVGENNSLFVVGDPDQTIYTWRGANLRVIMNFDTVFKGTKTITLDKNYRSTKSILNTANKLIKNNKNRLEKNLVTDNDEGEKITYFNSLTQKDESQKVVNQILRHIEKEHLSYKEIAILYRANYLSREIEMALSKNRIPYKIFGGIRFYERKEIKDALAYLRLLLNKEDDMSFTRVINEPRRGLGESSLEKFQTIANENNLSLYDAIKNNLHLISRNEVRRNVDTFFTTIEKYRDFVGKIAHSDLLNNLLEEVKYFQMLGEYDELERTDNLKELSNNLLYFESYSEDTSLGVFLQEVTLYTAQDEIDEGDYVSLMTVHTAKGLEFSCVFVIGLNEGVFPSYRSINEANGEEEERRLAYVAFTRAKKFLHLSSNSDFSYVSQGRSQPSRFLSEIHESEFAYEDENKVEKNNKVGQNIKEITKNKIVWSLGDKVDHISFGFGVVVGLEGDFIKVAFKDPSIGVKKLIGSHGSLSRV